MRRLALAAVVVSGLALFAGYGSASNAGHWVATDIDHYAQLEFPGYTGRYLLGLTAGGRVLWTAQKVGGSQWDREVFQWRNGQVSDLGALPRHMLPNGWNGGGAIVGGSQDPPYCPPYGGLPPCTPGPSHAYLWQPGAATSLGSLGGTSSRAWAINDRGQIIGDSQTARGVRHAFLWQDGKIVDISPPGAVDADATAINDRGQILEEAQFKKSWTSYLWDRGTRTAFDRFFQATALNVRGQVTGVLAKPRWRQPHVALWRDGRITDLGPSDDPYETLINGRGDVVFDATHRGMLWRRGKITDLGDLGGGWTFPAAINDRGQIVGTSTLPGSEAQDYHAAAFIWQDGKMTQLPESVDFLGGPMAIDASGTDVVLGWPLFSCLAKGCAGQIVLWTYVP